MFYNHRHTPNPGVQPFVVYNSSGSSLPDPGAIEDGHVHRLVDTVDGNPVSNNPAPLFYKWIAETKTWFPMGVDVGPDEVIYRTFPTVY